MVNPENNHLKPSRDLAAHEIYPYISWPLGICL